MIASFIRIVMERAPLRGDASGPRSRPSGRAASVSPVPASIAIAGER